MYVTCIDDKIILRHSCFGKEHTVSKNYGTAQLFPVVVVIASLQQSEIGKQVLLNCWA